MFENLDSDIGGLDLSRTKIEIPTDQVIERQDIIDHLRDKSYKIEHGQQGLTVWCYDVPNEILGILADLQEMVKGDESICYRLVQDTRDLVVIVAWGEFPDI